ncbi:MAG: hypothetical protein V4664_01330 [Patescibacteria group bacterium]
MSIAEEDKNINSQAFSHISRWLVPLAAALGISSSIGLGILWGRVNEPAPIVIECSDEVLEGLQATSSPPIERLKVPKKGQSHKTQKK